MSRHETAVDGATSPAPTRQTVSVSVVIPVYNKERYIGATLDSVLSQTLVPAEIVVVDDGSSDRSAEIVASYESRVRLIRQQNAGESVARNVGIEASKGDWIALLDGDDVWEPRKLEQQFSALDGATCQPVCVYSDAYLFDDSGQRIGEHRKPEYHAADDWRVQMLCDWSVNTSSVLLRRAALAGLRFPRDIKHSEDMIFFIELRASGPFLKVHENLVGYRRNADNQTASERHHLDSVASRWQWYLGKTGLFDESEQFEVRQSLARQLLPTYSRARHTTRDTALARECRRLYREIHPNPGQGNRSMRSRIYPGWTYRLWDQLRGAAGES